VRTSCEVAHIIVEHGAAVGVRLTSGETLLASRILSNADAATTYLDLLPAGSLNPTLQRRASRFKQRGRSARILLALRELPQLSALQGQHFQSTVGRESDSRERLRGRIHIGADLDTLERASDDARLGRWSSEPVLDICIPTIMDPQRAPAGQHIMEILVQSAPYHLASGSWDDLREPFARSVIDYLDRAYMPGLKDLIMHRFVLTPLDLERTYGLREGHLEHGEHGLDQLFFLRPTPAAYRYASSVESLYLCGGGTHPGGGTTGASGANAAREILSSFKADEGRGEGLFASSRSPIAAGLALLGAGLAVGATMRALSRPTRDAALERRRTDDTTEEDLQV
jgi:phytoene dehydrogenase-like protein